MTLVRAELDRPVSPVLIQTDASGSGFGVVYTTAVSPADLRKEVQRPRGTPPETSEPWVVERALGAEFTAPINPANYRVAARGLFQGKYRLAHINPTELTAVVTGEDPHQEQMSAKLVGVMQSRGIASLNDAVERIGLGDIKEAQDIVTMSGLDLEPQLFKEFLDPSMQKAHTFAFL